MVLQGDEPQVEDRFDLFGDSAKLDGRLVHGLRQTYHRLRNRFGHTQWHFKVTSLKWKIDSICLETMLNLTEDWCTVCTKCTIGSKIVLDTPDATPR